MKPCRSPRVPARTARLVQLLIAAAALALVAAVASPALAAPLVVIDAGHGGPYNHARYRWLTEKQANLLFALELGAQLQAAGYEVAYTRASDTAVGTGDIPTWHWVPEVSRWVFIADGIMWYPDGTPRDDLQARVDVANNLGADLFISIHCNGSASRRAVGTENWAAPNDPLGSQLGSAVQSAVLAQTHQRNRGANVTNFYVTQWSNMPALLIETGFMSNPSEGSRIASWSWRQSYVRGIVNGVNQWIASTPYRQIHPRWAGATPSDTAVLASRAGWPTTAPVVLLGGSSGAASALSAPLATRRLNAPILLADPAGLSQATAAEIVRLKPSRIVALGGTDVVSDEALASALATAGLEPSDAVRYSGTEPAAVAALFSDELTSADTSLTVVFASVTRQGDALAASALAASRTNAALVLVHADGSLPPEAQAFLAANASNIKTTLAVGPVPPSTFASLPAPTRFGYTMEPYYSFVAAMNASRPSGGLWLFAYNPAVPAEAVIATCAATHTGGGVSVPVYGKYLSPYVREWLENSESRVYAATVVGNYYWQPAQVDYMLVKAVH